jgi:DNA-binding transcriptional regulator GbsR (MarR family)
MQYDDAKDQFIQTWGNLATQWGINRTMAQIHATMLLSTEAMSTDDVMEELQISRGNANMNVRALIDWGLVQKVYVKGDRKEFFVAIKDSFTVARRIAKERQRRELVPVVGMLEELSNIEGEGAKEKELKKVTGDMLDLTRQVNQLLSRFGDAEPKWWQRKLLSFLK